jgi:hypothetical protein
MPKFLDAHPLKDVEEETLRKAQKCLKMNLESHTII